MSLLDDLQKRVDALTEENTALKMELSDTSATLAYYNGKINRMISYWRDLTGYEMITPTIDEAIEHIMQFAARVEEKDEEIAELTEQIDDLKVEQEWMIERLRSCE